MLCFYEIKRKYEGRFGEHGIHLRKARTEWAGNKLIELDMRIVLNGAWSKDPHVHLAAFHFMQENAIAAPLIVGGKPMAPGMSLFVLHELEEEHTHWLRAGMLLRCTLELKFREYLALVPETISSIPGFGGLGQ